jgi:metal-responsive CopG/Arc/MetJ family transcriptional regulator
MFVQDYVYSADVKNIQVTIDQATLAAVDRTAVPLGLKRSEIMRLALRAGDPR